MRFIGMIRQAGFGAAASVAFATAALAGPQYVNRDGYALSGYDAVAYHTAGAPTPGLAEFTAEHNGVTWLFASVENRDLFVSAPQTYAPAYDGHCAYALADGRKVRADPELWRIVDGRLYVNFNDVAERRWLADIPGHIAQADAEFVDIEDRPPARPGRHY